MIIGAGEPGVLFCEALSRTPRNEIEVCRVLSDFINRRPAPRLACKTCEYARDPTWMSGIGMSALWKVEPAAVVPF